MFDLFGYVQLFFQLFIRLAKSRQGDIELVGQDIQALTEFADFIAKVPFPLIGKIKVSHGEGQVLQFDEGFGHALSQVQRTDAGHDQPDDAADDDEMLDNIDIFLHGCDGLVDDDVRTILNAVDEVKILKSGISL